MEDSKPHSNRDLTIPLAVVAGFLGLQLWQANDQLQALQQKQTTCQVELNRTDTLIDKLRGFNR
jgi:hypothetical protein